MSEKIRVLIVDDDKSIRETLAYILDDEGYEYDMAETGKEALEKTKTGKYNIVLLDFRLPDIEGTKLIKLIKDTTPKMRKIMITGFPTMNNAIDALNLGADAFVTKPFDVEDVLRIIKEQLKNQEEELKYSQQKVAEYIESQFNKKE